MYKTIHTHILCVHNICRLCIVYGVHKIYVTALCIGNNNMQSTSFHFLIVRDFAVIKTPITDL